MNEYGDRNSWVKKYSIDQFQGRGMDLMGYSYKMLLLFSGNMGGNAAFMYVSLLKNPIEGVNWCQRYLSVAAVDNIVRPEIQPTEMLEHQRKSMPTLFLRFQ